MYAERLNIGLLVEQTAAVLDPYSILARRSFAVRKEMIEAARVLAPGDPFTQITTQHATVVANAITRSVKDIR